MRIPVYTVSIPEYKLRKFNVKSTKVNHALTPWYNIQVPKVYVDHKPDFELASSKIIKALRKHFIGRKIGLRLLSSTEHRGKNIDDLIVIIKKLGTDRYHPHRRGDRYDNIEGKHIDFFALDFEVGNKEEEESVKYALESFYYYPIFDRHRPIRIDLGIIYDLTQVERVEHRYLGRENETKRDGFVFKFPDKKQEAVLAILKIV